MKNLIKNSIVTILALFFVLSFASPATTLAATTPSLGAAATYGVLGGTYTNTSAATTVNGDVGFTTGPAQAPLGVHTNYGSGAPTPQARTDTSTALTNLAANSCTETLGAIVDLSTVGTHPTGIYTPGVYCSTGAMSIGAGGITLNGAGTYIFRAVGALTSVDNSVVTLSGASACDVFWTPTAATTLGATTTFRGTIIDNANAITVGATTGWVGRALSLGAGTVTTGATNTITAPTCVAPTLTVTKVVVNTRGGTKVVSNFPLFIDGGSVTSGVVNTTTAGLHTVSETADPGYTSVISGACASNGTITLALGDVKTCTITNTDIAPTLIVTKIVVGGTKVTSDFPLFVSGTPVVSGVTNTFSVGAYTVTETNNSNYIQSFSGSCVGGNISLALADLKTCTITNTYVAPPASGGAGLSTSPVPPLIDLIKIPSPLALPNGPGPVTYTYTLRNIGTVPVSNITMVGDTCSPITLVSGDTNNNAKLDVNETWIYTCQTNLTKTNTNIVTATGWANGISAVHIASATVVVGASIIPPLIHVTKVPSPLLLSAGGGTITYTNKITNPGTVALSNVRLTDDKCGPVKYISGDTNGDSMLDTNETWTYTCQTNLNKTTTNTVTATGEANGLTARDFAIVTVVVAVPGLPKTGFPPKTNNTPMMLVGILTTSFIFYIIHKKQIV